jgi:hypothetical protein
MYRQIDRERERERVNKKKLISLVKEKHKYLENNNK